MIVLINGKEEPYALNSIDIDDAIGQRSTASFNIVDKNGDKRFKKGQNVEIYEDDGTLVFSGVIDRPVSSFISLAGNQKMHGITCADGHYFVDKRIIAKVYKDWAAGDIVKDMINNYLEKEGIWYNPSALEFDGSNDFVKRAANFPEITRDGTYTFECWAYWKGDTGVAGHNTQNVFINCSDTLDRNGLVISSGGDLYFQSYDGAYDGVIFGSVPVNEWFHIAAVSENGVKKLYVNGILASGVGTRYQWITGGFIMSLDALQTNGYGSFNGRFDDVRIWNTARTQQEIKSNMNRELSGNEANLVCYWKFNEETGTVAKDSTANGNDGTISGATYTGDVAIRGDIQPGATITEAIFNYVSITDAMESLSEKAGYEWHIDANKALHFFARSSFSAPVNITETSDIKDVKVEPAAEDYRNKQYIRAGKDITDPQTQEYKGDGKNKSFVFPYELALEPVIQVDGVAQTVGIRGLEDTQQWFWNKGDKIVSQADGATPLTSSQTLTIIGQGYFDIVVVSYDQTAIDERKGTEGGTGIHEDVLDDPYLTSRQSAFESASAKLRRYAKIGNRVSFLTKYKGLRSGQLININLSSFGIESTDFLIENVKAQELGTADGRLIYEVSAVDGAATGGWANFFKKIATRGQAYVIRENIQENEVLVTLGTFTKTWLQSDSPNIYKETYPSATLYPGAALYPDFEKENRVKYMSFFDASNNEIFRKGIQKQTENTPGELISTTLVLPFEANGVQIDYVGWFGGLNATSAFGTGILIDKQPYSKLKTDLESIQIEKTDVKGW